MIVPSHFVPLAAPGMIRLGLKWMWNPESPFYIRPRVSWDLLAWLWRFKQSCNADMSIELHRCCVTCIWRAASVSTSFNRNYLVESDW